MNMPDQEVQARGQKPVQRFHVDAALNAALDESIDQVERASMLLDVATSLHRQAQSVETLRWAAELYEQSAELFPDSHPCRQARARARAVTAQVMAGGIDVPTMQDHMKRLGSARDELILHGDTLEAAQCDMHLGIIGQQLAQYGQLSQGEAVAAYQRALLRLTRNEWPCEYAVIQCNLASIYLQRRPPSAVHESLALQALESALGALDRNRHPSEFAMVQNNLGNALQSVSVGNRADNLDKAIKAYDEALRIRTREADPMAYATTLANKASCLCQLPDQGLQSETVNTESLGQSLALYREAVEVLELAGDLDRSRIVRQSAQEIMNMLEPEVGRP